MKIIKFVKGREIRMTLFSTGKPFDPSTQKRTKAIDDLIKKRKEKENGKLGSGVIR